MSLHLGNGFFDTHKKEKIIGIVLIVIAIQIIGLVIFLNMRNRESPPPEPTPDRTLVEDTNPTPTPVPVVEEKEVVSRLLAKVTDIRDYGTKLEYVLKMGEEDSKITSLLKVSRNSVFINMNEKKIINPSEVEIGTDIILYATGKYNIGDLEAEVIGVGGESNYIYGKTISLNQENENQYIATFENLNNKAIINEETVILDGYTGEVVPNKNELGQKERLLFLGELKQDDTSEMYICTEVIRLGT